MTDEHTVIARCTFDGVTRWSHVANQLGRSVDSVRSQYDPTYLRSHIWAPSREPQPEMTPADEDLIEPTDMSSPYVRGPTIAQRIMIHLKKGPSQADDIAESIHGRVQTVRVVLSGMVRAGQVHHSRVAPYYWALVGMQIPEERLAPISSSPDRELRLFNGPVRVRRKVGSAAR